MPNEMSVRPLTKAECNAMLAHVVRVPAIMERAINFIRLTDFDQVSERGERMIFDLVCEFHKQFKKPIPCEILYQWIDGRCQNSGQEYNQQVAYQIKMLAHWCFSYPEDQFLPAWANAAMEAFAYDRRVRLQLATFGSNLNKDMLVSLAKDVAAAEVAQGTIITPFGNDLDMLGVEARDPIGIMWLDKMINGGVRPGELYGIIAPSSGGKTTITNQIGISYASLKRHFAILQYEEYPARNEFMVSVIACASGIKRARIEAVKRLQDFTPEEQEAYLRAKKDVSKFLHFVDMSASMNNSGTGGVAEIGSVIRRFKEAGIILSGFAIDWFLPMAKRCFGIMTEEERKKKGGARVDERSHYQNMIDELRMVAGRNNTWCWIAHQRAPSASKTKDADWTEAAEFKSLAWLLNGCFALGELDSDNIGRLVISKNRHAAKGKVAIQLHGDIATFKAKSDDMHWDGRLRKYVKAGQERVIPTDFPKAEPSPESRKMEDYEGKKKTGPEGADF